MKRRVVFIIGLLLALPWPICMAYLFYLGFSRNEWLDDLFFHWEGISVGLLALCFIGAPMAGVTLMKMLNERAKNGR